MPFLCTENVPQKCKWLQCVCLVIHKRRSPTGDAAAPHRRPRASRSGADQAHTLSLTNRPLNRLLSLCKITNAGKHVCMTKSAAGSGAVPAEPLGIGYRFSPPRARFRYTFVCFSSFLSDIVLRYIHFFASFYALIILPFSRSPKHPARSFRVPFRPYIP